MNWYRPLRATLFRLPPEGVHHLSLRVLQLPGVAALLGAGGGRTARDPRLARRVFGLTFPNPIGLAAGFDKNAAALPAWEALGFGFAELGTITPLPQPGNPKPRIFRLPQERGIINRLGFPNDGVEAIARRLENYRAAGKWPAMPVGLNIGKGKDTPLERAHEDYLACYRRLRGLGDYFVVNISSPNTPGLRQLQEKGFLRGLLQPLAAEVRAQAAPTPLLVKIAPDLSEAQLADLVEVLIEARIDGVVATNTTLDKSGVGLQETGGLSGAPLREKSTQMVRFIHQLTQGRLPIIGVGGIFTGDDAREKLDAGAALVQVYTGFVYEGPGMALRICRQLALG